MKKALRIILILAVAVVLGGGGYYLVGMRATGMVPGKTDTAKENYAAVFLANDQVYFGKIKTQGKVVVLSDVYYIRVNSTSTDTSKTTDPQLSLVKLGDQIHGPEDEMRINGDQVLFVERIKDDSTVVKAIKEDKKQRAAGTTNTNTNPTTETPAATTTK